MYQMYRIRNYKGLNVFALTALYLIDFMGGGTQGTLYRIWKITCMKVTLSIHNRVMTTILLAHVGFAHRSGV